MKPEVAVTQTQRSRSGPLVESARQLCRAVNRLRFALPVAYVYNPLDYAWAAHAVYLRRYGNSRKSVLFVGMNPGPFGMVQTGVPFGQIAAVRDWLQIEEKVRRPTKQHPKRLVTGFACARSEISGERLWGLFARLFGTADAFFKDHFVVNYCPLAFVESTGRNRTPDKLPAAERTALFAVCDKHLRETVELLQPDWIIGVGDFATERAQEALGDRHCRFGKILHPSPACPASNIDWGGKATGQLQKLGVWL